MKLKEEIDYFNHSSFPSFGNYSFTCISKDFNDSIIGFKSLKPSCRGDYQIRISNNIFNISSIYFPKIANNSEIQINAEINLQELNLLTPLFVGDEFYLTQSNLHLFKILAQFVNDKDLLQIHEFAYNYFQQIQKLFDLYELKEEIFDLNLDYFQNYANGDTNEMENLDYNYIARFIFELGCSQPSLSQKIAKFSRDLINIIDSNENQQKKNKKSLQNVISEYFILQLKNLKDIWLDQITSQIHINGYLYRQFFEYGIIDKDDLLETIFSLENPKCLLWFLDILPSHMKQLMEDLIKEDNYSQSSKKLKYISQLSSNDFNLFKKFASNAENENAYSIAIRNDEVDQLQMLLSRKKSNNILNNSNMNIGELVFDVAEFPTNTNLLNYAAFFGSIKCFKYLLLNGAEIESDTFEFAIYGQNSEIMHIIAQKQKIQFNFLIDAVKLNSNAVFDWLYDNIGKITTNRINILTRQAINHYNFHAFFKLLGENTKFAILKENSIKSGNYEVLKLLNLISTETPSKKVTIFDSPTYETIIEGKMNQFPSHLKFYQIGRNYELFEKFITYKTNEVSKEQMATKFQKWFLMSVQKKNYFQVKYLLHCFDFVDFINNYEKGFLRCEVIQRDIPSILYLIINDKRININATPKERNGTAFTLATCEGFIASARILYNRGGVDINAIGNLGETPLTCCIQENKPEIVDLLVSFDDLDVNKPNNKKVTPFQMACKMKNGSRILTSLLKRKDLQINMSSIKEQFQRGLLDNRIDLVKAIYSHPRVDVEQIRIDELFKSKDIKNVDFKTIYELAKMMDNSGFAFQKLVLKISDPSLYIALYDLGKSNESTFDQNGIYPYYYAIKANKPEMVEYLLQFPQIDVNAIYPKKGVSPLVQTIRATDENTEIFKLLFACDRLDFELSEKIAGGERMFLDLYIKNNKYEELSLYLEKKLQIIEEITDDLFCFLIENNFYDHVKFIISNGYRNDLVNYALIASLQNPTKNSKLKSISKTNDSDLSLFDFLIDLESKKEISLNFNYQSIKNNGKTALIESVIHSRLNEFDILLKKDEIDVNIEDDNHMSAYDYAESQFYLKGSEYMFSKLIHFKSIDLTKRSYNDQSLSRINFIINAKNDSILYFILATFPKEKLNDVCSDINLKLVIKNICHFKSLTLLHLINNLGGRVLEKVDDECSFAYQFLKFFISKENDRIFVFKDSSIIDKFIKIGFDINSTDSNGDTLLMFALKNQKFEAFTSMFSKSGVNFNFKNKEGKNLNQIANEINNISVINAIQRKT